MQDQTSGAFAEMPKYQSHKKVWAHKIKEINQSPADFVFNEPGGSYHITPDESGFASFPVSAAFVEKHKPEAGGYYVVYADGYTSYSPAKAFEEGNTRIK